MNAAPFTGKLPKPSTSTQTRLHGSPLLAARIAWVVIFGLSVALLGYGLAMRYMAELTNASIAPSLNQIGMSAPFYAGFQAGLDALYLLTYLGTALLIFVRRSDDWMAIFVSIVLITFGGFVSSIPGIILAEPESPVFRLALALEIVGHVTFVIFLYILPDGKFAPRWTIPLAVVWTLIMLAWFLFPTSSFSPAKLHPAITFVMFLGIYLSGVAAQTYRQKHYYTPAQDQQVKWVTFGLFSALGGFLLFYVPQMLIPAINEPGIVQVVYGTVGNLIGRLALMMVPITIAFSMLRYRLWDVDFVINRGLVFGGATLLLVAVFVACLLILQRVFLALTGGQQGTIAFAVSALIIGGAFQPVRKRLQGFIDRRFYGIQVEYHQKAASPAPGDLSGSKLGPYEVIEPLGRGGMAEVYKGRHPTLGRVVAIKLLPATMAKDPEFRHRFEREAKVVAGLKHPNIVQVFDFGEEGGTYYMVMEYVEGHDLADTMREVGPLPLEQARQVMEEIAGALDYAHEQGIVHRDIKPSNVMLEPVTAPGGRGQRAVLMDFGIARMVGAGTKITGTGLMGTFDYMAPEQIRDAKDVDGRADIYSLGVMAFQMLTGKLPFSASNPGAMLIAHMQQPAPDPRTLRVDLPEEATNAILKALEKDPAQRYATAGEMVRAMG